MMKCPKCQKMVDVTEITSHLFQWYKGQPICRKCQRKKEGTSKLKSVLQIIKQWS